MADVHSRNAEPTEDVEGIVLRAVDQLPAMIGCWDLDLRNVFANRVYTEIFGITPENMRGMHIEDVLGSAVYALNLPYITGALSGVVQQFERTLIDMAGNERTTQATYVPDYVDGEVRGFTALVVDVSGRVRAERERDEAVRMFRISMENAPIGKAVVNVEGRWLQVNRALCELTGYSPDELYARSFRDITHPDDLASADADLAALVGGTAVQVASEKRYIRKDGTVIWVQRNATIVRDTGSEDVIIAQIQDITARKAAEWNLARQAVTDDLTGLGNRRHLMSVLNDAAAQTAQEGSIGILYIDVDDFKLINDTLGHSAGDRVLIELAHRLQDNVRASDVACRVGGDEFVVVVLSADTYDDVAALAERVDQLLRGAYHLPSGEVDVSVSVGFSWSAEPDSDRLLSDADRTMYRLKRSPEKRAGGSKDGIPGSR